MTTPLVFFLVLSLNTLAVGLAILLFNYTGDSPYREGGFITFVSALQLLIIAKISFKIFEVRKDNTVGSIWKSPAAIWKIIGIGFLFLFADEILRIHENLDNLIHSVFNLQETAMTDRIDDIIVGLYGLVGIGVLFFYREELKTYVKNFSLFILGFVLLFIMVLFDILSHGYDMLVFLFGPEHALMVKRFLYHAEDSIKIFAEAVFLLGFYVALQNARQAGERPIA